MSKTAAITVARDREEVERLWREPGLRPPSADGLASVRFIGAPGDHGTEIHVEVRGASAGGWPGDAVRKLTGRDPLAGVKDDLRHFKQRVETGVIARSDAIPEGESLARKLHQRPAQPLTAAERRKVGV